MFKNPGRGRQQVTATATIATNGHPRLNRLAAGLVGLSPGPGRLALAFLWDEKRRAVAIVPAERGTESAFSVVRDPKSGAARSTAASFLNDIGFRPDRYHRFELRSFEYGAREVWGFGLDDKPVAVGELPKKKPGKAADLGGAS